MVVESGGNKLLQSLQHAKLLIVVLLDGKLGGDLVGDAHFFAYIVFEMFFQQSHFWTVHDSESLHVLLRSLKIDEDEAAIADQDVSRLHIGKVETLLPDNLDTAGDKSFHFFGGGRNRHRIHAHGFDKLKHEDLSVWNPGATGDGAGGKNLKETAGVSKISKLGINPGLDFIPGSARYALARTENLTPEPFS